VIKTVLKLLQATDAIVLLQHAWVVVTDKMTTYACVLLVVTMKNAVFLIALLVISVISV